VTTLVLQSVVEVYDECWQVTFAPAMGAPVVESMTLPWIEPLPRSPATITTVMAGGGVVGAMTGVTDGVSLNVACWAEVLVMMGEEVDEGVGATSCCKRGKLQAVIRRSDIQKTMMDRVCVFIQRYLHQILVRPDYLCFLPSK
jgi:hypothetical protein